MEEEEDDPFSYKPLKKRRKTGNVLESTGSHKKRRTKSQVPSSATKKNHQTIDDNRSLQVDIEPVASTSKACDGHQEPQKSPKYCFSCQMPFSLLMRFVIGVNCNNETSVYFSLSGVLVRMFT